LFEQVELLEGLQSVDSEDEVVISSHTEARHELLELDVIEDHGGDVMGVQLGHGLVGLGLNLGGDAVGVALDGGGDLDAEVSSMVVSLLLGVRDAEGKIFGDLVQVELDSGEHLQLWVLLHLGSLGSGGLVGSDVLIRDGIGSNIWEGGHVLGGAWVVVVVVSHESRGRSSGNKSAVSQEFHYLI